MTKLKIAGGMLAAGFIADRELGTLAVIGLALLVVVLLAAGLWHRTRKYVPRNRVRAMRMRLHLRLRAGHGFATAFELWLRWSRFAAWRKSSRIRPSMTSWARYRSPEASSALIGRAQLRLALRVPHEEHLLVTGPPRTGKSGLLASLILAHQGPLLSTSTKHDMFELTSGIRSEQGPIAVFNPGGIGGVPSTITFDPVAGSRNPEVAVRRSDAFTGAISMKGAEDGGFFSSKASSYLRAMFAAADLAGGDLRLVNRWVTGSARQAEEILAEHGMHHWANELAELRGDATKTAATTKMVLTRALAFMASPTLAQSVLPGGDLDVEGYLQASGTLYMIADSANEENPVAPVFAAMAAEWHHTASLLGSKMPGGRLDPPLRMALDEVVSICPVPLPAYLSDSGGKGVTIAAACHSISQLRSRWHQDGAAAILSTAGTRVWLAGTADIETVEAISKLSGTMSMRARFQDHHTVHPVVDDAMARSLPPGFGIVLRGGDTVTIARLEQAWKQKAYKQAKRRGCAVAELPEVAAVQQPPALTATRVSEPVPADAPEPWWVSD